MDYANSKLELIISDYLRQAGQDVPGVLGGDAKDLAASPALPALLDRLEKRQASAQIIIYTAVAVLASLFLVGVALIVYHRDAPSTMAAIFGGNFFSLLIVVHWLRRLWLEKTAIDTLLIIVSGLPAVEAVKIILKFHFSSIQAATPAFMRAGQDGAS